MDGGLNLAIKNKVLENIENYHLAHVGRRISEIVYTPFPIFAYELSLILTRSILRNLPKKAVLLFFPA
jgi:hypothetical protein